MEKLKNNTITDEMSVVLDKLMASMCLNEYVLVGGTALSLQLGHRKSVDLDLFTTKIYDPSQIKEEIHKLYPDSSIIYERPNSLGFNIQDIKVEFVEWKEGYELEFNNHGQWRLLKKEIIAAMKLNAIIGRTEKKDYTDLAFLLKELSLKELLLNYKKFYPYQQVRPVLEKLAGSSELSNQPDPYFLSNISWPDIEFSLKNNLRGYYDQLKQEKLKEEKKLLDKVAKYKNDQNKGISM